MARSNRTKWPLSSFGTDCSRTIRRSPARQPVVETKKMIRATGKSFRATNCSGVPELQSRETAAGCQVLLRCVPAHRAHWKRPTLLQVAFARERQVERDFLRRHLLAVLEAALQVLHAHLMLLADFLNKSRAIRSDRL
jgi:hypothetical protein